jgi:Ca-activated chloride channel homolog
MRGFHFSTYNPNEDGKSKFQQLLDLFMQLLTYTSGDVTEAMQWMNELDKQYQLTNDEYGMGDFIDELKEKGYLTDNNEQGQIKSGAWKKFLVNSKKQNKVIIKRLNLVKVMK